MTRDAYVFPDDLITLSLWNIRKKKATPLFSPCLRVWHSSPHSHVSRPDALILFTRHQWLSPNHDDPLSFALTVVFQPHCSHYRPAKHLWHTPHMLITNCGPSDAWVGKSLLISCRRLSGQTRQDVCGSEEWSCRKAGDEHKPDWPNANLFERAMRGKKSKTRSLKLQRVSVREELSKTRVCMCEWHAEWRLTSRRPTERTWVDARHNNRKAPLTESRSSKWF